MLFSRKKKIQRSAIALTTAKILDVNHKRGLVKVQNIDAINNNPVLDLKAYFPVCDRVKEVFIPDWILGWPEWLPEEGLGL